jgi:Na+-driven multidrug efflux pump
MWAANGANLLFNLLLTPIWGAVGSAWATVGSRALLFAGLAVYVTGRRDLRPYLVRGAGGAGYGALLAIGVAAAASATVEAGAFASLSLIAGRISAPAVAVFAASTGGLVTLAYLLAQGYATAAAVLVSEAAGRGQAAAPIAWRAILLAVVAMAMCGGGCWLFADRVAGAFTADPATHALLTASMPLAALLMIPDGGQGVADAALRAQGWNWTPTLMRAIPFVALAPPLAYWLGEHAGLGVIGVLAALNAASGLAFLQLLALQALRPRPIS